MVDRFAGDGAVNLTTVLGTALHTFQGAPDDEMRKSTIRAAVDSAAACLWASDEHGGLTHTRCFGIFPFCGVADEEDALGPDGSASQQGSVVAVGAKRARAASRAPSSLAAFQAALSEEDLWASRAQRPRAAMEDGLETPPKPTKKTKATRISVETQVSAFNLCL